MAKITGASLARELLDKHPDIPSRQAARMLYEQNRERFVDLERARDAIRDVRGAHGKRMVLATHKRPKQKAGWKPACPPSAAEPWLQVQIDGPCKVLSLSDIHCPYHDPKALESAVAYGRKLKPDVVLINGDFMDFAQLSRWEKRWENRSTVEECRIGEQCLGWLRSRFPKARFIYKLGNHDERLDTHVWNKCPELWGMSGLQLHNTLEFEKHGVERVNDNPIMVGKLPVLHGHEAGKGISAPVNPARGLFLRTLHSCLQGHYHRTSTHCEPDMFKSETTTWSQGCLCDMTPLYARINKWNLGFAFIDVAKDNQFDLHNYRLSNTYTVRAA